jgi:7-cyano-7-deazaguanine synthase
MTDIYAAGHWALEGRPPGYHTPDEDVYLPGRNVMLLSKAAVFCAAAGISRLAIGTLAGNPFADATPAFRHAMSRALSLGLSHPVTIEAPFESLGKADIIRRGVQHGVPFELTLSCMNPATVESGPLHCGLCSKCRERHDAFLAAESVDPTTYRDRRYVGGRL